MSFGSPVKNANVGTYVYGIGFNHKTIEGLNVSVAVNSDGTTEAEADTAFQFALDVTAAAFVDDWDFAGATKTYNSTVAVTVD